MSSTSTSFNLLDPRVQKWIWNQDWSSLKDIQENSIPIVLKRDSDVIISASTAGGKTEAAFLPILTNLLKQGKSYGFQVLYVSPLKAQVELLLLHQSLWSLFLLIENNIFREHFLHYRMLLLMNYTHLSGQKEANSYSLYYQELNISPISLFRELQ